jgi:hypothetical protein
MIKTEPEEDDELDFADPQLMWQTYCWVDSNSLGGFWMDRGTWVDNTGQVSGHRGFQRIQGRA